jgi:hypothetical protein
MSFELLNECPHHCGSITNASCAISGSTSARFAKRPVAMIVTTAVIAISKCRMSNFHCGNGA